MCVMQTSEISLIRQQNQIYQYKQSNRKIHKRISVQLLEASTSREQIDKKKLALWLENEKNNSKIFTQKPNKNHCQPKMKN